MLQLLNAKNLKILIAVARTVAPIIMVALRQAKVIR